MRADTTETPLDRAHRSVRKGGVSPGEVVSRLESPNRPPAMELPGVWPAGRLDFQAVPDHTVDSSPARISRAEVAHLARLARLAVTEQELDVFAGQLDVILGSVARVGEVAAADIEPTTHAVPLRNVLRPDEVGPCLDRSIVLAQAPAVEDNRFRVPRILDDEQ